MYTLFNLNIKEKVIEVLVKHPEGLTIIEISKILGIHRHTLTKYIYQLIGEDAIKYRMVGTAKLCYLSEEK